MGFQFYFEVHTIISVMSTCQVKQIHELDCAIYDIQVLHLEVLLVLNKSPNDIYLESTIQ